MGVSISLEGKNALVTGGGGGMGKCTAMLLAEAGANVMISDLNIDTAASAAEEISAKHGVKTAFCKCNVANKDEVEQMVKATVSQFGCIDVLNHIAGVSKKLDFLEITEAEYDTMMDINAKGTFFVDQAVLRVMIPNRRGKIVNMSSQSGKYGYPTNVSYTASKFAVTGLTQSIAQYAAPYNINVNCVCPGIVYTPIWEQILNDIRANGGDADAYWSMRIEGFPLKRPQTMEDIARMFLYLSSSFADNMTGQSINITGGRIMH